MSKTTEIIIDHVELARRLGIEPRRLSIVLETSQPGRQLTNVLVSIGGRPSTISPAQDKIVQDYLSTIFRDVAVITSDAAVTRPMS